MIVSEAESKTVECFCFCFVLDFVFGWSHFHSFQMAASNTQSLHCVLLWHFLPNQLHSPPVRKSGKEPVPRRESAAHPESTLAPSLSSWEGWRNRESGDKEKVAYSFPALVPPPWGLSRPSPHRSHTAHALSQFSTLQSSCLGKSFICLLWPSCCLCAGSVLPCGVGILEIQ